MYAPPPPRPHLRTAPPGAHRARCGAGVPYWPETPFCYNSKKRMTAQDTTIQDNANAGCSSRKANVWHKKFLLFPKVRCFCLVDFFARCGKLAGRPHEFVG